MSKLNVHRTGTKVSLWRGTGSRLDLDVNDVAVMLRALGIGKAAVLVDEWAKVVHERNGGNDE